MSDTSVLRCAAPTEGPLIRFDSEWTLRAKAERETDLRFHDVAP
jgi:hypothetical protein